MAMTKILRHARTGEMQTTRRRYGRPEEIIAKLKPDGTMSEVRLLSMKMMRTLGATVAEVREIQRTDRKNRFEVMEDEDGNWRYRSTQGHSLNASNQMDQSHLHKCTKADLPSVLLHGTRIACVGSIDMSPNE